MSCADLAALLAGPPVGCTDTVTYLGSLPDPNDPLPADLTFATTGVSGDPISVTVPRPSTTAPLVTFPDARVLGSGGPIYGQILIPPTAVAANLAPEQLLIITDGSSTTFERLQAAAAQIDPALTVSAYTSVTGEYQLDVYRPLIVDGSIVMLIVAFASVMVAAIDRAAERRKSLAAQSALGVPTSTILSTQMLQVLLPYGSGIFLAAGLGLLSARAYEQAGGFALTVPARSITVTCALATIGAVVVATSSIPALGLWTSTRTTRRE